MFARMDRSLRAARLATFAYFALNGFVMGIWVVHIPAVEHRAGISHAVLGWLLLLLGGGAFAGMQVVGPLTDRFGARRVVPLSAALCSAAVRAARASPPTCGRWAAALLVLGFGNGCLDVSMNTHAVQVERRLPAPVMSAFHAIFSIGGVLAALVGARTPQLGLEPTRRPSTGGRRPRASPLRSWPRPPCWPNEPPRQAPAGRATAPRPRDPTAHLGARRAGR